MDNAMVKRGIGAIVLAIIAALLLGWLLKDKSNQRQEVIDMEIPSLTDSGSEDTTTSSLLDSGKSLINNTVDNVKDSGAAIIASASGTTEQMTDATSSAFNPATDTVTGTAQNTSSMKPGFAIRPSQNNEEKQIIDNTQATAQENNTKSQQNNTKIVQQQSNSTNTGDTVIASTTSTARAVKKTFKPQIVEKKKKIIKKKAAPTPKKVAKVAKVAKVTKVAKVAKPTTLSTTPTGKYSIQLLATSSQSRANKLAQTMKGEGYQVFVTETTRNDKILFRVRVGGHNERRSAIKAQEGMKKRYLKNFFVQNSLVISN